MGYYTTFTISHIKDNKEVEGVPDDVKLFLLKNRKERMYLDLFDICCEDGESNRTWYNHHEDMLKLSKEFPHHTLILHGEGEEAGDLWRHIYQGGERVLEQKIGDLPPIPKKFFV